MNHTRKIALVLSAFILLTLISTSVAGYSLSASTSQETIDIVNREINNEIGSATISSVSTINAGDSVAVEVGVDSNEVSPNLQIRNQDNSILRLRRNVEHGSTWSFDSSAFVPSGESEAAAGTYSASLWSNGEVVAAHPIVVQGYDISITAPSNIRPTETTSLTADISERDISKNSDPKYIELTIGNDNIAIQKEIDIISGKNEYTFDINANDLELREYNVYVAIRGDKKVLGEDELLAIKQGSGLAVTDSDGSESDDSDGSESDDSDSGESSDPDGGNEDDEGSETVETNVTISNVSFEPSTVNNVQDKYTLSFSVANVSTDGNADEFSISVPDNVAIENVENVQINKSEYTPSTTVNNNTIEVSVNPDSAPRPENLSVQLDLNLNT